MPDEPTVEIIDGQEWLMAKCWAGCWHPWLQVIRVPQAALNRWQGAIQKCRDEVSRKVRSSFLRLLGGKCAVFVGVLVLVSGWGHPYLLAIGAAPLLIGVWVIWTYLSKTFGNADTAVYWDQLYRTQDEILREIGHGELGRDHVTLNPTGTPRARSSVAVLLPSLE